MQEFEGLKVPKIPKQTPLQRQKAICHMICEDFSCDNLGCRDCLFWEGNISKYCLWESENLKKQKGGAMSEEKRYTVEEVHGEIWKGLIGTMPTVEAVKEALAKHEAESGLHPIAVKVGPGA